MLRTVGASNGQKAKKFKLEVIPNRGRCNRKNWVGS